MNNKLAMEFDDHEWTLIVTALRRDAMRMRNTSAVYNFNLAYRIEEAVEDYQERECAVLSELRGACDQAAATIETGAIK